MPGLRAINISNMINKSKKEYAYTIIDIETEVKEETLKHLSCIPA